MEEIIKSFLRVFKKLPEEITESDEFSVMPDVGVIFNNVEETYEDAVRTAISRVFPRSEAFSNTFHSGWHDVFEKSDEELYIDQVLHYLTTYGFEYLNIDANGYVYLPKEIHKDPELRKYFYLQTISKEEAIEKLKSMLSGIALSERTVDDVFEILSFYKEEIDVESIKNKDVRIKAFSKLRIVPESPDECMKVINYLLTGKLTFVKNKSDLCLFRACQRTEDRAFIDKFMVPPDFRISQLRVEGIGSGIPNGRIQRKSLGLREHRLDCPHHIDPVALVEMLGTDEYPADVQRIPAQEQNGPADDQAVFRQLVQMVRSRHLHVVFQ